MTKQFVIKGHTAGDWGYVYFKDYAPNKTMSIKQLSLTHVLDKAFMFDARMLDSTYKLHPKLRLTDALRRWLTGEYWPERLPAKQLNIIQLINEEDY